MADDANFHPELRDRAIALIKEQFRERDFSYFLNNPKAVTNEVQKQYLEAAIKLTSVLLHLADPNRAGASPTDDEEFALFRARADVSQALYDHDRYNQDKGIKHFEDDADRLFKNINDIITHRPRVGLYPAEIDDQAALMFGGIEFPPIKAYLANRKNCTPQTRILANAALDLGCELLLEARAKTKKEPETVENHAKNVGALKAIVAGAWEKYRSTHSGSEKASPADCKDATDRLTADLAQAAQRKVRRDISNQGHSHS